MLKNPRRTGLKQQLSLGHMQVRLGKRPHVQDKTAPKFNGQIEGHRKDLAASSFVAEVLKKANDATPDLWRQGVIARKRVIA
jgi:hypothetical protein